MVTFHRAFLPFVLVACSWEASYGMLRGKQRRVAGSESSSASEGDVPMPPPRGQRKQRKLADNWGNMNMLTVPLRDLCESGCQEDADCSASLVCFQRSEAYQEAPGCSDAASDATTTNYCVSESLTSPPTNAPTPEPYARAYPNRDPVQAPSTRTLSDSTATFIKSRIAGYALGKGSEFSSTTSYQSKAVSRMAEVYGMESASDAKLVQFYVLYCIFYATSGVSNPVVASDYRFAALTEIPGWISQDGWSSTETDISALDPCNGSWYGIECDAYGRVTEITLDSNRLTGAFPPEVVLLALDGQYATGAGNLNRIDLFKNEFLTEKEGDTYWWWQHLGSNFQYLLFRQTAFGGKLNKLPPNVVEFDCSYTLIEGGLEEENFEGLDHVNYLLLDGNFFNTSVPLVLGRLPQLQFLYIADSSLTGDFSYIKEGMPKLYEHWVDYNPSMSGTIPTELGSVTTLASLSWTENNLSGTIPTQLGNLTSLRQLWLSGNNLGGRVPTELGYLLGLKTLHLEANKLSGSMPSQVCANYDGGIFRPLDVVGADCSAFGGTIDCPCCTCCSYVACRDE